MEILNLLEEFEVMGEEGEKWYTRFMPGFIGKTVLDAEEFFGMLHHLRSSLPEEMTTATQVSRDRQRIIEEAREERAKILEAAREQAQLLVSSDELVKQAEQRAEEMQDQAHIDAQAIRAEAETWARGIVERLENYVNRISATIGKTRKALITESTSRQSEPFPVEEE